MLSTTFAIAAIGLLFAPTPPQASRPDLDSLTRGAHHVVLGTVTSVDPVFQTNEFGDELIVSRTHFQIEEVLKRGAGGTTMQSVIVELEGGSIGDMTLTVSDLPTMVRGERAVVFLRQNSRGALVPYERGAGILKLDAHGRVRGSTLDLEAVRKAVSAR